MESSRHQRPLSVPCLGGCGTYDAAISFLCEISCSSIQLLLSFKQLSVGEWNRHDSEITVHSDILCFVDGSNRKWNGQSSLTPSLKERNRPFPTRDVHCQKLSSRTHCAWRRVRKRREPCLRSQILVPKTPFPWHPSRVSL